MAIGASVSTRTLSAPVTYRSLEDRCTPPSPLQPVAHRLLARFQHTAMLEGMLLLLLALGGGQGPSPAAAVPAATAADAVVGVWRGTWAPEGAGDRLPVEAIV